MFFTFDYSNAGVDYYGTTAQADISLINTAWDTEQQRLADIIADEIQEELDAAERARLVAVAAEMAAEAEEQRL